MGAWGTGIYSNDTAEDVKCICQEIFPFVSVEEGNKIIFDEYEEIINSNIIDNDYASFWYALADWQWNHGILTEDIRSRTLELLRSYAGISDWEDSGSAADVKKRKAVIDKLRNKLESPQPTVKLPKAQPDKPKHKRGDIIVFEMDASRSGYEHAWQIKHIRPTVVYASDAIRERITERFDPPRNFAGNYSAVICVGTVKEPYSRHISGVYNETSVYAFYNYCSPIKPTMDVLSECGFLPHIHWIGDGRVGPNHGTTVSVGWGYKFILICERFKKNFAHLGECCTLHSGDEADRFENLLSRKQYSEDYYCSTDLTDAFSDAHQEKLRLAEIGVTVDDLLDADAKNPELRFPDELDRISKVGKYREALTRIKEKLEKME